MGGVCHAHSRCRCRSKSRSRSTWATPCGRAGAGGRGQRGKVIRGAHFAKGEGVVCAHDDLVRAYDIVQ